VSAKIGEPRVPVVKPFYRTCRQLADGTYQKGGHGRYVSDPRFAIAGPQYVRAFLLIQKDLLNLFDYVEPADVNLNCYSYRIHELHMRVCIEVEANCKAILTENGYVNSIVAPNFWTMNDYRKLNATHHLSSYEVRMPHWHGTQHTRTPFAQWTAAHGGLSWYQAYNSAKHDRHNEFPKANFEALLSAMSGLVAILSSQFITFDFKPGVLGISYGRPDDGFDTAIGDFFHVKFPTDWSANERYSFDWQALKKEPDAFQKLTF
jgi:hypothetical protein